jgi:2'-hydroxyisoflavone reductase
VAGSYNAVGPVGAVTLAGLIAACATAAGSEVQIVEVPAAGGSPGLPLVLDDPKHDVLFRRSAVRARAAGLTATPLVTTAADVLAWDGERGAPLLKVGPTEAEEAALLGQG